MLATVQPKDEYTVGETGAVSATVENNDVAIFTLMIDPVQVEEGLSATVQISINDGVTYSEVQTIDLEVTGEVSASDYSLEPGSVTLPAGSSSASAILTALEDDVSEDPETAKITANLDGDAISSVEMTLVAKAPSADAALSSLSLTGADIETFDPSTIAYTASVSYGLTSTTVTVTPRDEGATVTILPTDVDTTVSGHQVALAPGDTAIGVTIISENEENEHLYTVTVTRAAEPLTANWVSIPEIHDGIETVTFRVEFSEPIATGDVMLRDHGFRVTHGGVRQTLPVDGRSDLWDIGVAPTSNGVLEVVLPETTDCDALGAVCTSANNMQSHRLEATVEGALPVLSVFPQTTPVAEGDVAQFEVHRTGSTTEPLDGVNARWNSDGPEMVLTFLAGLSLTTPGSPQGHDEVVREDREVMLTLESGAGYEVSAESGSATVVVEEGDVPAWSVAALPSELEEGESATVRVSITNGVTYAASQVIGLEASSSSASATDYVLESATLELEAGSSEATTTLSSATDEEVEDPEMVTVMALREGVSLGTATVNLVDPLRAPELTGIAQVGMTLEADSVGMSTMGLTYQWLRDGEAITGATLLSHELTAADAGTRVSLRVLRGDRSVTSAAVGPVWPAPGNPPVGSDEEELLGTELTVGSTDAYPLRLGGYGLLTLATLGTLEDATLLLEGVSYEVTFALLNSLGRFALGPRSTDWDETTLWAYWNGHRIGPLGEDDSMREGPALSGATPLSEAEYRRITDGSSDGIRVALSIRRELPLPTATLTAVEASVAEGDSARFEVTLDDVARADLAVDVEVAGSVLAGASPDSVTVLEGLTTAMLTINTDDDLVVEGDGTVTAALRDGAGYELGATTSGTVTVTDNDAAVFEVTVEPTTIREGTSAMVLVALRDGVTYAEDRTLTVSVTGTVTATDYALGSKTLTLAAGAGSVTTTLEAVADEADEMAKVGVSLEGSEVGSATLTISSVSSDATLADLTLTDVELGTFDGETTDYASSVANVVATTTVEATPRNAEAQVEIEDASGSTQDTHRTSRLATGANAITTTVRAEDGVTTRTYTVTVTRAPAWGERLPDRDIAIGGDAETTGVWSDSDTIWVVRDWYGDRFWAYELSTGARRSARDIWVQEDLSYAGLWSDGETLWAASYTGYGVHAYLLSDGARQEDSDLTGLSEAGNDAPTALWLDDEIRYVVDSRDVHAYAYDPDGAQLEDQEFGLWREDVNTGFPWGAWRGSEVLLTSWYFRDTLRAYQVTDRSRLSSHDIELGASGNDDPRGLWSDGDVLWVMDGSDRKLYAYAVPGLGPDGSDTDGSPTTSRGGRCAVGGSRHGGVDCGHGAAGRARGGTGQGVRRDHRDA